jgi:hypothetical protein
VPAAAADVARNRRRLNGRPFLDMITPSRVMR